MVPSQVRSSSALKCRTCRCSIQLIIICYSFIWIIDPFPRHVLAHGEDILHHKPGEEADWKDLSWVQFALSDNARTESCRQAFFVIPPTWINAINAPQGKLNCPKCRSKLGAFSWNQSLKCPCAASFQPAFYFTPSRVDFIVNKWVAINFIWNSPKHVTLVFKVEGMMCYKTQWSATAGWLRFYRGSKAIPAAWHG